MKKLKLFFLFSLLALTGLQAQQRIQYSQYLLNAFLSNPAVAGTEEYVDIKTGLSQQWIGFEGAPKSGYISVTKGFIPYVTQEQFAKTSLPVPGRSHEKPTGKTLNNSGRKELPTNFHLGLGATIFSEKTGPISYNGLSAAFAGHIHLNQAWRLSIGASLEILNYRLDPSAITFLEANDVAISSTSTSLILPSMNAGFALYTKGFFLAGATRQLLQNRIQINSQNPYVSGLEVHYLIQSGFRVELSEDFQFTPSLALRFRSPAAPSWELSLRARIKDFFYIGASYRHQDAITGLMGLNINHMLSLYYAYDFTTSTLRKNSAGTHSLVLNLRIEHAASSIRQYFW